VFFELKEYLVLFWQDALLTYNKSYIIPGRTNNTQL
jgi:hypothetical protein